MTVPLHLPHTYVGDVGRWINHAVSDALSLGGGAALQGDIDKALTYFTTAGQEQYRAFLRARHIEDNLTSGAYELHSAVKMEPLLIGQQESGGLYKWLYEVPVLLSYLRAGTTSYDKAVPQNLEVLLSIQVTRVAVEDSDDHDILIELWREK